MNEQTGTAQPPGTNSIAMYGDCELSTRVKSVLLVIAELWLLIYHRVRNMRTPLISILRKRKLKKKKRA